MLPRDYGRLEIGSRWFDRKLTVGSAVRYYGKSKRATTEERYIDGTQPGNTADPHNIGKRMIKETETIDKQPLVVDFYVAYEPIENLVIRADIQNAFDKNILTRWMPQMMPQLSVISPRLKILIPMAMMRFSVIPTDCVTEDMAERQIPS